MSHSNKAVAAFDQYAKTYQEKYMDVSLYEVALNCFCSEILPKNASILELGCGPGNVTKFLVEKRPDLSVLATDLSPKMLELAAKNVPQANLQALDYSKLGALNKKFQGIMASFCLPYLTMEQTEQLIADSSKLLHSGGILYLSTMEDDYKKSSYQKGSAEGATALKMHYYLERDIVDLLEKNNFSLIFSDRKQYKGQSQSLVVDLIIIAQRK